jgi:hypothetical protein
MYWAYAPRTCILKTVHNFRFSSLLINGNKLMREKVNDLCTMCWCQWRDVKVSSLFIFRETETQNCLVFHTERVRSFNNGFNLCDNFWV